MAQPIDPKQVQKIQARQFLASQICLIVEPSVAFSTSVRACLQELGIPGNQIFVASKFSAAKILLNEKQPTILISEYKIENASGFELFEMQEKMHEESKRISFITSKTSSASVIAEAAEGQVDGYLLKPFSIEIFRKHILEIIRRKSEPTPYLQKIAKGKQHRDRGEFELALAEFETAKAHHAKPALAHYYIGETLKLQGRLEEAIAQFREGRKWQSLHYKCVIGEFETLAVLRRFDQAFELVPVIGKNFPMSSPRLLQLFETTLEAGRFDMLPRLYELYRDVEERSAELVAKSEEAFFLAGQIILGQGETKKAIQLFDTGLQISGRSLNFIEKVVVELVSKKAVAESEAFLAKASPSDVGTPPFIRLTFRVNQLTMTGEQLLNKGRELVFAGHGTPEIFHLVVRSFAQAGKETLAETAIGKAVETNPELRTTLYQLLADHLPKQAKQAA